MTGDEIFNQIKDGFRWGTNDQPSVYLVTAILEQLPIVWIAGSDDRLQFMTNRDLTPLEHWALDRLTPDEFRRDGHEFDLWWD